ncbi:hypothetical protein BASA81_002567 [Batrachochytrium salamandrivorans]|nr:hypothetical protein BASA81_002567 [Batrachochytrium salamandrivorans]
MVHTTNGMESTSRMHNFLAQSYGLTPTTCFVCQEFLNGFWQQGFQCSNCSINVHELCRPQTSKTCFVTHRFKETSYISLPICAACGQPMLGLWNQGFQCEDCGLDVHAACRTQSSISTCKANAQANAQMEHKLERKASLQLKEDFAEKKQQFLSQQQGSSGHNLALAQANSDLPTDMEGVIKEMKRLHEEILSSIRALELDWENITKPGLKAQRAQLEQSSSMLKQRLKDKQKKSSNSVWPGTSCSAPSSSNSIPNTNASKLKTMSSLCKCTVMGRSAKASCWLIY